MQDRYDYRVTYRPDKNPENPADYMSRYMAESSAEVSNPAREAEQYVNFIEIHAILEAMSATNVKKAILEDDTLQRVIENMLKDHPRKIVIDILKALKKLHCEMAVKSGRLLLKGTKLIIPKKLQDRVVELAQGIVKTKRLMKDRCGSLG